MDIKTAEKFKSPITQCIRCLNDNKNRNLLYYNLQSEALKAIFQVNKLFLCYLCKKMIENAEIFIQTVLSNQILLEDLKDFADEAGAIVRTKSTKCSLGVASLDLIELTGADTPVEPYLVYNHGIFKECVIKDLKEEANMYLDEVYMDDEIDMHDVIKEENLESKTKLQDSTDLCIGLVNEDFRNNVKQCKKKMDFKDDIKIQRLQLTKEQCTEERNRKASEKKFVDSPFKCMDCIKGFSFKPSYDKHLELHSKQNGDYECAICKLRMDSEHKLHSHQKYHKVRFKCLECGIIRTNKSTVSDHYNKFHSNTRNFFMCKICFKKFECQRRLTKHMSSTHTERVTCAHCMKTYANKDVLRTHLTLRHPKVVAAVEVKKNYICLECGKAFRAPSQLRIHSSKHTMIKDYYCVECDKSFKNESGLKQHLKTTAQHVAPPNLPLACSECDKKFAIKRALEQHMNRVHLNIRPFKCDQCDRAYVSSSSLKDHRKLAHEGFKRPLIHPCPMCDKVFDRNSILKGHIRTHTGERPFQCSECPASFSQSGILGTHMKLVHLKQTRNGKPKPGSK